MKEKEKDKEIRLSRIWKEELEKREEREPEKIERIVKGEGRRTIKIPRSSSIFRILEEAKKFLGMPYWKIVEVAVLYWWEKAKEDIQKIKEIRKRYEE